MNDIVNIELVFENLESMKIPIKCFEYFHVSDLNEEINKVTTNCMLKQKIAGTIAFKLSSNLSEVIFEPLSEIGKEEKINIVDRLIVYSDISSIYFEYTDGKIETVYPLWSMDSEYSNTYQKSYLSKNNELFVVIHEVKEPSDFFEELKNIDEEFETAKPIKSDTILNKQPKKQFKINPAVITETVKNNDEDNEVNIETEEDTVNDLLEEIFLSGWEGEEDAIFN